MKAEISESLHLFPSKRDLETYSKMMDASVKAVHIPPPDTRVGPGSLITKCFWGPDGDLFKSQVQTLLGPHAYSGAFAGDNLVAFGRSLSFLTNKRFMKAFDHYITPENYIGQGIIWRLYLFCWAAEVSLKRDGDFVECGVATGTSSAIMCRYLDFAKIDKSLYLFDAWEHKKGNPYGFNEHTKDYVQSRFAEWPNVKMKPGLIPKSLSSAPGKISFLHIDLNNAEAEVEVLKCLYDRVSSGGIILLDDYGFSGFSESKRCIDSWAQDRGITLPVELPTGQGLLIK